MTFEEWEQSVPESIRGDVLWRMCVYRLALFLSDLAMADAQKLARQPLFRAISDQLARAAGNISSSIAEGYSRGTGRARATFYEYSLGSARESRDWYYKGRRGLASNVVEHRLQLTTEIAKLLVTMISRDRRLDRKLTTDVVTQ